MSTTVDGDSPLKATNDRTGGWRYHTMYRKRNFEPEAKGDGLKSLTV